MEKAWQESEAAFIGRSIAWPKKSDPSSYSLKTYPQSVPVADGKSLARLPKWGMIVDGALYPLRPLERFIVEKGGSYWPTPKARDYRDNGRSPSDWARHSPSLPVTVMMATITASQANKPIRAPSPSRMKGVHGEDIQDSIGRLNPELIGKKLCPEFVECLMGYPTGWTELNALVMPWFLSKRKRRSKH
jgi:DNA (cytosine-5)-methyltransferase 1